MGIVGEGVKPGDTTLVRQAAELDANITRLPGPGGQIATLYAPSFVPVDAEEEPVDIEVLVHSIRYLNKMRDGGARYTTMYQSLLTNLTENRAARAGIVGARSMPPGMGDPRGHMGGGRLGG